MLTSDSIDYRQSVFQLFLCLYDYSKTCVKRTLSKRQQIGFQDQLSLNADQKHCRMLIKLPFVIQIFVLSIFELPFYTGFAVNIRNGYVWNFIKGLYVSH